MVKSLRMLWTVNFELSHAHDIIIIRYSFFVPHVLKHSSCLYTRVLVHVGFLCELGLLSNFDENSCSYCHIGDPNGTVKSLYKDG